MNQPGAIAIWRAMAALVLIVSGSLAACSATPPATEEVPSGPAPTVTVPLDLPVTISLAGNFDRERLAALDALITDYEAANPDVRVEVVRAPKDIARRHTWISEALRSGDRSIDILLLDATWPAEFAADGGLVGLDEHLGPLGVDTEEFLPGTIQANTLDGHLVALPWTADGGLLYYRQDLLGQQGYDPPVTWTDLQRVALEVRNGANLPHGYVWQGTAAENLTCITMEHVWSTGGNMLDGAGNVTFEGSQTEAALRQMNELVLTGASPRDIATYDDLTAFAAFQEGKAVFLREWFAAWEYLNSADSPVAGLFGIAPLPASCLGGQSLALSAHSPHPERALHFMAYLAAADQQVQMALVGNQPPASATAYTDAELLAGAPWMATLGEAFSVAQSRPSLAEYARVSEIVYTEVNRMLAGEQDAGTTAANIQHGVEVTLR